jgi:glutamate decarboxylase
LRAAHAHVLGSDLAIMGAGGYAVLIDHGMNTARALAREIEKRDLLERTTPPELNIITYRICPLEVKRRLALADHSECQCIGREIDRRHIFIRRQQREAGRNIVSRTTLPAVPGEEEGRVVLRAVIMNPMTDKALLREILDEQTALYEKSLPALWID